MMTFLGMKSPAPNIPIIELETPTGDVVDLYNDYQLRSVELRGDELSFRFVSVSAGAPTGVQFSGVRDLRVAQPAGWVPQEADQIEHFLIRPAGPWRCVVFKAGGFHYEFDCAVMTLAGSTIEDT